MFLYMLSPMKRIRNFPKLGQNGVILGIIIYLQKYKMWHKEWFGVYGVQRMVDSIYKFPSQQQQQVLQVEIGQSKTRTERI